MAVRHGLVSHWLHNPDVKLGVLKINKLWLVSQLHIFHTERARPHQ